MGRGIDFKGVNLVVNYDFPTSSVAYIHRIGKVEGFFVDGNFECEFYAFIRPNQEQ